MSVAAGRYKLSFTSASLSIGESIKIAEVYLRCEDWEQTKVIVANENVLQSRTTSRTVRLYRELAQRLKMLSVIQLELLVEGTIQEQKQMLWYAVCKRYRFIQDFAIEVLHEKFLGLDLELTELDYDAFFNRKADWHEELDAVTETTRAKLKQVLFRMLREAGLTTDDNLILQAMLSQRVIEALNPDSPMSYQIFPIQSSMIRE